MRATDGSLGRVVDFLLDDQRWAVRYLVVATGGFFGGRRILISPIFFREADWSTRRFHLALTMAEVKNSPPIDLEHPVSRQRERDYYDYYGYPFYWGYPGLWGMGAYPGAVADARLNATAPAQSDEPTEDVHLRGATEIQGYHVEGSDEAIGHVDDFIVDDETWAVRYLVVDTSNWWFGKKVLVAPHWANRVSWEEGKVYVTISRQAIKASPAWDPTAAINRAYEENLYDYYVRTPYWASAHRRDEAELAHHSGRRHD